MAIYYDTVTRWQTAEANSYPISTNVVLETLITLLVQVMLFNASFDLTLTFSTSAFSVSGYTDFRDGSPSVSSVLSWLSFDSLVGLPCRSKTSWMFQTNPSMGSPPLLALAG